MNKQGLTWAREAEALYLILDYSGVLSIRSSSFKNGMKKDNNEYIMLFLPKNYLSRN